MHIPDSLLELPISKNLHLRQATVNDAGALYDIIDSQRNYFREWLPFVDLSTNVSATELYLHSVTIPGNTKDLLFIIVYDQETAGLIGFKEIDHFNKKLEIGYWLSEKLQGKGIVTRSCDALIRYSFEQLNMNRIQIKVGVGNYKSSNIAKKLHFIFEGIQRDGEFLNGKFHDLEVYSLLRREWQS